MLATVTTTEATIPATLSHQERRVRHTPNADGDQPHDAKIVVTEHAGVRVRRILQDTYLAAEQFDAGAPGRVWLVLKDHVNGASADTVKGQKDAERVANVYECHVDGEFGSCTCDGFVAGRGRNKCVHMLALQSLVAAGLPDPRGGSPSDSWPSAEQVADDWRCGPDDETGEFEVEPYRDDAEAEPAPEPEPEPDATKTAKRLPWEADY